MAVTPPGPCGRRSTNSCVLVAGQSAQLGEEPGQVGGQIAGVGRPRDGVDVDGEFRSVREVNREGLPDAEARRTRSPIRSRASMASRTRRKAEARRTGPILR